MANTQNRLAGTCYVNVNGTSVMVAGDFSYKVSGVTRETLKGQDRVHGYKELPEEGAIWGTLRDSSGLKLADFNAMTSVTITLELANGKTVSGAGMWTVGCQEAKTGEGTFDVRWEGETVEEI